MTDKNRDIPPAKKISLLESLKTTAHKTVTSIISLVSELNLKFLSSPEKGLIFIELNNEQKSLNQYVVI